MSYKYVPEKWRKKFVPGQKVWFIDHIDYKILSGTFDSYEPYDHEYEPTMYIKHNVYGISCTDKILEAWTFPYGKRADAEARLRIMVKEQIEEHQYEINSLRKKLKK